MRYINEEFTKAEAAAEKPLVVSGMPMLSPLTCH
jgi:hypothetical protein